MELLPTQYIFLNFLSSCAAHEALDIGRKIHSFIVKLGASSVLPVANSLLNMYAKSGDSFQFWNWYSTNNLWSISP